MGGKKIGVNAKASHILVAGTQVRIKKEIRTRKQSKKQKHYWFSERNRITS
jgi:hypothetical protein